MKFLCPTHSGFGWRCSGQWFGAGKKFFTIELADAVESGAGAQGYQNMGCTRIGFLKESERERRIRRKNERERERERERQIWRETGREERKERAEE
ncbi:hypothetical protein PRUPE_1G233500 [Prunus persica]|uniref:Uncharacterized protein n=1 Tax=Prunus persica TaxID=3760 RepID=A0A251R276_PRUPE|nr:hypothetical protein PRUPE_1G233500 [Prunus persica]